MSVARYAGDGVEVLNGKIYFAMSQLEVGIGGSDCQ